MYESKKSKEPVLCNSEWQEFDMIDYSFSEEDHFHIKLSKYILHKHMFAIDFHYFGYIRIYNSETGDEIRMEYPILRVSYSGLITLLTWEKHTGTKYFIHINL